MALTKKYACKTPGCPRNGFVSTQAPKLLHIANCQQPPSILKSEEIVWYYSYSSYYSSSYSSSYYSSSSYSSSYSSSLQESRIALIKELKSKYAENEK